MGKLNISDSGTEITAETQRLRLGTPSDKSKRQNALYVKKVYVYAQKKTNDFRRL